MIEGCRLQLAVVVVPVVPLAIALLVAANVVMKQGKGIAASIGAKTINLSNFPGSFPNAG